MLAAGDPGTNVLQPVAQGLGFGPLQVGFVGQQHRLREGGQVRGDQGELDPDLVHVGVQGRWPMPVSFPGPDPGLRPGVRAVSGVQERELPAGGVDGECLLIPVSVPDLERVQGRTGCGCSRRPMTRIPG